MRLSVTARSGSRGRDDDAIVAGGGQGASSRHGRFAPVTCLPPNAYRHFVLESPVVLSPRDEGRRTRDAARGTTGLKARGKAGSTGRHESLVGAEAAASHRLPVVEAQHLDRGGELVDEPALTDTVRREPDEALVELADAWVGGRISTTRSGAPQTRSVTSGNRSFAKKKRSGCTTSARSRSRTTSSGDMKTSPRPCVRTCAASSSPSRKTARWCRGWGDGASRTTPQTSSCGRRVSSPAGYSSVVNRAGSFTGTPLPSTTMPSSGGEVKVPAAACQQPPRAICSGDPVPACRLLAPPKRPARRRAAYRLPPTGTACSSPRGRCRHGTRDAARGTRDEGQSPSAYAATATGTPSRPRWPVSPRDEGRTSDEGRGRRSQGRAPSSLWLA